MSNKFRVAVRKFGPFETALQKTWDAFCKAHNCTMELEAVPMDLHPLYDATLGKDNGLINGDWDIAHINTDWITEAQHKNALEDLAPYIASSAPDNFPDGWSNSLLHMQRFEDKVLGLPFHDGPECLIYRKDLFEAPKEQETFFNLHNKPLSPPKTWEDFHEIARFFNRPEQNLFGSAFALFPDGHNTVFDFCLQLWTRGGNLLDKNGSININTPEAIEGLEFYRNIIKDTNAMHPKCKDFDSVKSGMAFANGEIAMMVNWFGFASMCEVYQDSKVKGCVDITHVPAGKNGQGVSLNVYWLYTVAKGSKNKDIAYDFIKFAVNPENDKLLTLEGGIGCRKSTWTDQDVNQTVPYYHKLDILHSNAKTLPRKMNWSKISEVIDVMVTELFNTDKKVAELVSEAQQKIDSIESP
ncbi:ABC transporter substrate-binding protein [Snuella sedimenti]|uniref:Sugar ABC transporter substrate-binding protein n=1 Tax=Snuella sedimenti TaxID=2798802 RepID=A0A8J7IN28_9FLAO|nr:sugar ABC transporter substrate-binding protein [Snuella sedimenti]MBJ6367707.1 sugar ABC transporter substrate-binding protein [Snuella sedimenti]